MASAVNIFQARKLSKSPGSLESFRPPISFTADKPHSHRPWKHMEMSHIRRN